MISEILLDHPERSLDVIPRLNVETTCLRHRCEFKEVVIAVSAPTHDLESGGPWRLPCLRGLLQLETVLFVCKVEERYTQYFEVRVNRLDCD